MQPNVKNTIRAAAEFPYDGVRMKHTKMNADLTEGSVWRNLLVFFLPVAAGTIIQQLYNAVDGLIVGRFVGTNALAAVG